MCYSMTVVESKELRKKVKQYIDHADDRMVKIVFAMLEAVADDETHENEERMWRDFSAQNFLKGYGADEPEYSLADIKEPNAAYKEWKEK